MTTLRYEVAGTSRRTQSVANERRALRQLGPPAGPLHGEWKCADTIGTVLVPWAGHFQCQKNVTIFSSEIYGNNFIKQHSETVRV